jgi:general secretion pathway protein L
MPNPSLTHSKYNTYSFGAFLRWWSKELSSLVPRAMRPKRRPEHNIVWLSLLPESGVVWHWLRGRRVEFGQLALAKGDATDHKIAFDALRPRFKGRPIGLCVSADQVLRKEITLPIAASVNLVQALSFELGRYTPFSASQAYFDYLVTQEDRHAGVLQVKLTVIAKQEVDNALNILLGWGVNPLAIMVDDEVEGTGDCVNLLPSKRLPAKKWLSYWKPIAMTTFSALLLATAIGVPIWQKRAQAIAINHVMLEAQLQAEWVDKLKQERDQLLTEYNFPVEQKLIYPSAIGVLNELSALLPDDTWLQLLEIRGNEVILQGSTHSSPRLVGLFENTALFKSASYKSPLIKLPSNEERFQLTIIMKSISLDEALAQQRPKVVNESTLESKKWKKAADALSSEFSLWNRPFRSLSYCSSGAMG